VPFGQVLLIVVRKPDLAFFVFPHKRFLRQIDTDRLRALHERRARLRVAKNHHFGRAQVHFRFLRRLRVVHPGNDVDAFFLQCRFQPSSGFLHAMRTLYGDETVSA
jgi:hypothetical protein